MLGSRENRLPTPEIAWELVRERWQAPVLPAERVSLLDVVGRVAASGVRCPTAMPPFDRAAMDGYAIRCGDLRGEDGGTLEVMGEVPMGTNAAVHVEPGQAVWVATGSMLPPGADTVVKVELTKPDGLHIRVDGAVRKDDNIAHEGADLRVGDLLLEAGRRVRPQDVAVLAAVGIAEVAVVRRPRVAILVTGDELREPGSSLDPGQIHASNGYALHARVQELGGEARLWPIIPDQAAAIGARLREALEAAELVLVSGGCSVGRKDLTLQVIEAIPGTEIMVHGVAAKPGRPTLVATAGDRLVIGIPGNPLAALVAFAMFGEPAMARLLRLDAGDGACWHGRSSCRARLDQGVTSRTGRQEHVLVTLRRGGDGTWRARPLPPTCGSLAGMVLAYGLLVLRPDRSSLDEGEEVDVTAF